MTRRPAYDDGEPAWNRRSPRPYTGVIGSEPYRRQGRYRVTGEAVIIPRPRQRSGPSEESAPQASRSSARDVRADEWNARLVMLASVPVVLGTLLLLLGLAPNRVALGW